MGDLAVPLHLARVAAGCRAGCLSGCQLRGQMLVQLQVAKLDEILLGSIITKSRLLGCCSLNTLKAALNDRNQKIFVVCTTTRSTETTPPPEMSNYWTGSHWSIYKQIAGAGELARGGREIPGPGPLGPSWCFSRGLLASSGLSNTSQDAPKSFPRRSKSFPGTLWCLLGAPQERLGAF